MEINTRKLTLLKRIGLVAFIAIHVLLFFARQTRIPGVAFFALGACYVSALMQILTLVEIASLKKRNGGMPVEGTRMPKVLAIVFLVLTLSMSSGCLAFTVRPEISRNGTGASIAGVSKQDLWIKQDVWTVDSQTDEFGDAKDGQYSISGTFQTESGQTVYVRVFYQKDNAMGPYIVMAMSERVTGPVMFVPRTYSSASSFVAQYGFSQGVDMKVKVGDEVRAYRLAVGEGMKSLQLVDAYALVVKQMDGVSEGLGKGKNQMSNLIENMGLDEEKKLYDVKGMIGLLYEGKEDIKCVIEDSSHRYNFTIQPGNFKAAFDSIWNYKEVCEPDQAASAAK